MFRQRSVASVGGHWGKLSRWSKLVVATIYPRHHDAAALPPRLPPKYDRYDPESGVKSDSTLRAHCGMCRPRGCVRVINVCAAVSSQEYRIACRTPGEALLAELRDFANLTIAESIADIRYWRSKWNQFGIRLRRLSRLREATVANWNFKDREGVLVQLYRGGFLIFQSQLGTPESADGSSFIKTLELEDIEAVHIYLLHSAFK